MRGLGQILAEMIGEFGISKQIKRFHALDIWKDVVGERISQMTKPQSVRDGKLFVHVFSDVWRNELIYHKRDILAKLNKKLGKGTIQDIVFL
jgi:predicted nucleic acid-binding Zn ribbon protein